MLCQYAANRKLTTAMGHGKIMHHADVAALLCAAGDRRSRAKASAVVGS